MEAAPGRVVVPLLRRVLRRLGATLVLACVLAAGSFAVQRVGPGQQVEGEGYCPGREPCEVAVLGAGFPLAYLVDRPTVSVPGAVHWVEDDFRWPALAADVLFYAVLVGAGVRAIGGRRERRVDAAGR